MSVLKTKLTRVFFAALIIGGCIFAYFGCKAEERNFSEEKNTDQIELISECMDIVRSDYVKEVDSQKLCYGALDGMLSSLDEYSGFLDPDSLKEMKGDVKGEFGGLGMEVGIRDNVLTVIAPIDRTPAADAGIEAHDRIIKIDGKPTRDLKLSEAVKKLRGKPGTGVNLTIFREKDDKILDISVKRKIIKIDSITDAMMLGTEIGYIKLAEFQEDTPGELEKALEKLEKKGMKALIFDLRNNPGGLLGVAESVADKFLPKGKTIVSINGRSPQETKTFKARGGRKFLNFSMVVLVNGGSASASEIVAGAIKDNRRGIILGTKTYGKGSVQTVIPLRDGSALKLTTAAYYTPNGSMIKGEGIVPDVVIEQIKINDASPEKEDIYEKVDSTSKPGVKKYDNQITAAQNVLMGIEVYKKAGYSSDNRE
ncbi:MAG: S41 family peptidase [Candidatus Omnitrophota bacterium]